MDVLEQLRRAAEVRRVARRRVAAARWLGQTHSPDFDALRQDLAAATAQWANFIPQAVGEGHTLADAARAAGVAPPSLYYRLGSGSDASGEDAVVSSSDTVADQENQVRP